LLEAIRKAWLPQRRVPDTQLRFHHVSTDEVFGSLGPRDAPFKETDPYAPNSPYAASKAASDTKKSPGCAQAFQERRGSLIQALDNESLPLCRQY
jgi:hypothetical protein